MLRKTFVWKFVILLFVANIFLGGMLEAQKAFTPYEDLPEINKNYKPSYDENYPQWAKMLYQYPVNFNEITKDFDTYMLAHKGEKNAIIRYFKIWSRALAPYTTADGTIQMPDISILESNLRKAQLGAYQQLKASAASNSNWSFLGPKETFWLNSSGSSTVPAACPWQVNVYAFDVSTSDNSIIYAGTETHLVNKSTDNGMSWQLMSQHYAFGGAVISVAIHPENPDIVYVGAGRQIHKTVDGGDTWSPASSTSGNFNADQMKIDSTNHEKILGAGSDGVYISLDGGVNWTRKWTERAWDIEVKPDDDNIIYALSIDNNDDFNILMSANGGDSFSEIQNFPVVPNKSGGLLAVSPADPNSLYVVLLSGIDDGTSSLNSSSGTGDSFSNTGANFVEGIPYLYKGTVNNNTWTWTKLATGKTDNFPMDNGQGYFDLVLAVSPVDASLILVGTTTLYKSEDGGSTHKAIGGYHGNFPIHPDIQCIKMLPNGEAWVATDGGFTHSIDNFKFPFRAFSRNNGLIGSDMWGFHQGWNEDIVVGGRYHNGNTAIADFYQPKALRMGGAESPTGWVIQGKSRHVAFNDLGNGWILPKTAESAPEGRFIFSKYPNMVEYGGRRGNMVFHPNYYGLVYLGEGNSFWVSKDMGESFDMLYSFPGDVRFLQISYNNPNVFYADIVSRGLYRTSDGGETWERKPSLTSGSYGTSSWNGKLSFAISPYNEDVIYACLSNGAWSADIGKVFKSTDGGDTWKDWTGSVATYFKNMAIQPTNGGSDLVYLFTTSKNGVPATVYFRKDGMTDWVEFDKNYPRGMGVNYNLPFFRDSKIRVGGSAGVWESSLQEPYFTPIINPWVEKAFYNCTSDTLYFDDHSMLNHADASWSWSIDPEPSYISNPNSRNPKVVLGVAGSYNVTLNVVKGTQTYSKTIHSMVTASSCPSLDDCSNPAVLSNDSLSLVYADSEEKSGEVGVATNAIDGDPDTHWHTEWSASDPAHPHEIQVDMGKAYNLHEFTYLPRQNGPNGRIKDYELYVTEDIDDWGTAVKTGTFPNTSAPQNLSFEPSIVGRYFRLVALSEVNGNEWTSVAELSWKCCNISTTGMSKFDEEYSVKAFPVPSAGVVTISLPGNGKYNYSIYSISGKIVDSGLIDRASSEHSFNLGSFHNGVYFIKLVDEGGIVYRVKVVKE